MRVSFDWGKQFTSAQHACYRRTRSLDSHCSSGQYRDAIDLTPSNPEDSTRMRSTTRGDLWHSDPESLHTDRLTKVCLSRAEHGTLHSDIRVERALLQARFLCLRRLCKQCMLSGFHLSTFSTVGNLKSLSVLRLSGLFHVEGDSRRDGSNDDEIPSRTDGG